MNPPVFFTSRGVKLRGKGLPTHTHEEAQLTFAASGMVQIHTAEGRWLVPPLLAVWVPAGVPHRAEVLTDAELWIVHCQASAATAWAPTTTPERAFAVRVTPLLRALLDAAFTADIDPAKAELLGRLMLHELTETADAPTFLPMPTSLPGRRVADLAIADPASRLDLAELATRAATSVRTVSRLFPVETGLTFKAWRQRARIVHAMDRLSRGDPIARVCAACGFANSAAFSAAFRQVTAMTPTAFVGRRNATETPARP
jgi:AraC-like DNA-binding protein